ncbi:MAG: oligoendopeptidase F [Bacilli bacterium]|nr:oligoendopeptidase F [Bacilli bacterium]
MEQNIKNRSEIDEKYKWDLKSIYRTEEEFYKAYEETKEKALLYKKYEKTFLESSKNLYEFLQFDEKIERELDKLYSYAHYLYEGDTSNSHYQQLNGKVENLYTEIGILSTFVKPELLEKEYKEIETMYIEFPELRKFEKILFDIFRYKGHNLSKDQEKVVSSLRNVLLAPSNIYSTLVDTDMVFGKILDEENHEVELTQSNYSIYIESKNRDVRKRAFEAIYKVYKQYNHTIANTIEANTELNKVIANFENFNTSLEASLFPDEVSENVYETLIETVHKGLPALYKYYALKKNILGLEEYHLYDTYVNPIGESNKKYTFDEAHALVLEALKPLGDTYVADASKAFTDGWIDIYPNKGKRGGAFSGGSYDTLPFILLNYEGQLNSVSTLIHELGHSMHSYYTRSNQPYQTGDYKIFVAEVASTVNELFLYKYLLQKTTNKEEKLILLNELLDLYKATIFRQTMFAEFEKDLYEMKERSEILTADTLNQKYYDINKLYFGKDVVIDEEIKYEWCRIPHFYYNFYVYKYATGLSCATKIVNDILDEKEGALENYLTFLKSGNSYSPIELLQKTGCDLTKPYPIENAIQTFEGLVSEFEEIYNS